MIFAMLPLAYEWDAGAEFRAPMARTVIGGLITSTLLTLIVVPVAYTFLDDLGSRVAHLLDPKVTSHAEQSATAEVGGR